LLTQKELSPPAGRQILFLFTPMLHTVQHGCEQDPSRTMLPQAKIAVAGVHVWCIRPPRNSCQ